MKSISSHKAANECHKTPFFANQHPPDAQHNLTSARGLPPRSALHNPHGQGHQRAESCQYPSKVGWRRGTHIPSSHHKKTWSPSSSFKLESDAWWRETQHSHHELPCPCSSSGPASTSLLVCVLCSKQAHKAKTAQGLTSSRVASLAEQR